MGRAERRAGEESPACPKCKRTSAEPMAASEAGQRWQCAYYLCNEVFLVPGRPHHPALAQAAAPSPCRDEESPRAAPRDAASDSGDQIENVKEKDVAKLCDCGRAAGHTGRHRGKTYKAEKPVTPARGAAPPKWETKLRKFPSKGAVPARKPGAAAAAGTPGAITAAIVQLEVEREAVMARLLEDPELVQLDRALEALRGLAEPSTSRGGGK